MKKVLISMIKVAMCVESIVKVVSAVVKENAYSDEIAIRWISGIILGMIVMRLPLGILVGCVLVIICNCVDACMMAKSNGVSLADVVYNEEFEKIAMPIILEVESKYRPLIIRIMEM